MKEFFFAFIAIALLLGVMANFFNKDLGQHVIAKFMSMFHADTVQSEQDRSGILKKKAEEDFADQRDPDKKQAEAASQQVKSDEERARERALAQQEEMRRRMDSLKDKMGR